MFEKELVICGLRQQRQLLNDVIQQFEQKYVLDAQDIRFYAERSKHIEQNLKKLRELKADYLLSLN